MLQNCGLQYKSTSIRVNAIGANNCIEFTENTVRAKCCDVVAGFGGVDWWCCRSLLWRIIAQFRRIHLHLADTQILKFHLFAFLSIFTIVGDAQSAIRQQSDINTFTAFIVLSKRMHTQYNVI